MSQRDIDTEAIVRAVDTIQARQRPPSGEGPAMPCRDHETRIVKLEGKTDDHDRRLHSGDVSFAEFRKDVGALTEKVGELTTSIRDAVRWVLGTVGTLAAGAIVWALVQSQHVAAVVK